MAVIIISRIFCMLFKLRLASMSINKDTGNVNLQYASVVLQCCFFQVLFTHYVDVWPVRFYINSFKLGYICMVLCYCWGSYTNR